MTITAKVEPRLVLRKTNERLFKTISCIPTFCFFVSLLFTLEESWPLKGKQLYRNIAYIFNINFRRN